MIFKYFLILTNIILVFSNVQNKNLKLISKVSNNLRMLEFNNPILIGFDGLDYGITNKIAFKIYIKNVNDKITNTSTLTFPVNTVYTNGTSNKNHANCSDAQVAGNLLKILCEVDNIDNKNISSLQFYEEFTINNKNETIELSSLARASKKNIRENLEPRLDKGKTEILTGARIEKKTGINFVIRGNKELNITSDNIRLVTINNGERINIKCEGKNKKDDYDQLTYYLSCKSSEPLNTDLSNSYGYVGDKSFIIDFANNNSTTIDNAYYQQNKTSKKGLSTGGIIAIIIPSVIVLLGVLGLVLALRSKSPAPPLKEVANVNSNNTVGVIGSSSEAVVHQ